MEPGIRVIRDDSRRMGGRDPHETHRVATPLELLFDLTFATSFGLAASGVASVLAKGDFIAGPLWRHSRAVEGQRQRIHHAAA